MTQKRKLGKQKWSQRDTFWNLYMAFCYYENETQSCSEAIHRHNHFLKEQQIVKKIPKGCTIDKLLMLMHARRIWFGTPTQTPTTIYEYTWQLTKSLYHWMCYLHDGFKVLATDMDICSIVTMWRSCIERRFARINPESARIEEAAKVCRALAGMGGSVFEEQLAIVDGWRRNGHESDFVRLQGCLHSHEIALDEPCTMDTAECFATLHSRDERGEYDFTWEGKDICKFLVDVPIQGRLKFKEELFSEYSDGVCVKAGDPRFACNVSSIAEARERFDPDYLLDETKNHYLEGDNLRVLKMIAPQYRGKVKMIYVDPPYNTGNDFVYNDDFKDNDAMYKRFLLGPIPRARENA